ncbi:myosin light chain kinase, smooth muscle isoform X3 [Electrophorus electricus]|uniref:myosin light chain kinase, smooth muscle isoform X3 n=1 Tax=Electrophorus electricus TaxID=8005 RepID=UPI0015D062C3|nr:myosin light chain kinase, smooth muscle isoform X3 [Electrophorus electricus]
MKVRGSPEAQVCWFRSGKAVIAGGRFSMEQSTRGTFSLVVEGVQDNDAGRYTCEAVNDAGRRQVTVDIIVEDNAVKKYGLPSSSKPGIRSGLPAVENRPSIWGESPPKFVNKPSRLYLKVGQTGKFSAKITGRPLPRVQWFKGDEEIQTSEHYALFERSGLHFLEIRCARAEDAGTFACLLTNNVGKALTTADLTVQGSNPEEAITKFPPHDLPNTTASPTVRHTTSGLISEQKPNIVSARTVTTGTHAAVTPTTAANDSTTPTSPTQPIDEPKGEGSPKGQHGSAHSITLRGEQTRKGSCESASRGPERSLVAEGNESRGRSPVPVGVEPSREARRQARENQLEALGAPPSFDWQPQSQEVTEGAEVMFRCQVSGWPVPAVSWAKDGAELGPRVSQQEGGVHLLRLESVQSTDAGRYTCTATNSRGEATCSWAVTVQSLRLEGKAPVFSQALNSCAVDEGSTFTLRCAVEATPPASVSWLLNDKAISYGEAMFDGGWAQLVVQDAVATDDGFYSCVAENEHGRAVCGARVLIRAKASVKRPVGPPISETKRSSVPVFLKELQDLKVMDGSQVTMTVEVTGHPAPEVLWLHNGKEIQESEDFHFQREGSLCSLFIQEVFPEDTGTYMCEAWNVAGEAHTRASLTVQEPQDGVQPWFITKPKSSTVDVGQHVLLSCAIAGDPFPEFFWMKDGCKVSSGRDFEVLQKEDVVSLLIRNVKTHHAGNYEIYLKNKVGDCSCLASLLVNEDPVREPSTEEGQRSRGVERTARKKGEQKEAPSLVAFRAEPDPIWERRDEDWDPEEPIAARGLLKRRVETKEHREDQIRQKEAEQVDFRTVLGRKVTTKSVSEEDLKEITAEQMDFRGNLQRQIKPKTQTEEERKVSSPQQVDFRAVLGRKGTPGPKASTSGKEECSKNDPVDFRSVLTNKRNPRSIGSSGESPAPKGSTGKENEQNCVDGGPNDLPKTGVGKELVFLQKLTDLLVQDGERLHLQCRLSSATPASVTWTLDGKVIKSSKFIVITNEGGLCSLTIDKALPEDEGQYVCRAETGSGRAECSCMVLVDDPSATSSTLADKKLKKPSTPTTETEARIKKPPPKTPPKQGMSPQILQFPDDMKILAGERITLLCRFSGAPPIHCTWLKFRKPIQEGRDGIVLQSTESSSQLTIASGQQEDCGCYTIEIRNSYGMKQAALNLTIVDKPDPPARVPAATDIRKSSLTLSWYGPTYDGGSAVQSYNLEIWDSVGKAWRDLVSCNSTSYSVQNLMPGRQYKFRVRAANIYGIGEPSAESAPVEVGLDHVGEDENKEDELGPSDDESEKHPEYRDVTIRTDVKVKDLYDVGDRLGSGKFGTVFKLIEKSTKKVWAGKFIKAYSEKEKVNVRQEVQIMNDLHHPKLVQCVDAFEAKCDVVMVLEMVSGGELFERIIDEDFELTEREVIQYVLQIVDGVGFMHRKGVLHLDLKPENIMCVNKTGSKIKLIDFGLARRLENSGSLKVMFGTPEFVAPEVINYEAIGYPTDMWSIGVICYILVSGLSPFMGDNDHETLSNVTSATWDFEDEAFDEISEEAKDFISSLLKKDMRARLSCADCFQHNWLKQDTSNMEAKKLSKERMKKYLLRRKWQKTGHAVRAIGRLSSMALMAGVHAKKGSATEEETRSPQERVLQSAMKPTFTTLMKDVEVVEGSAARFDCKIEGYPDPEVVWYKDDQPIKETRHFQIDYDEDGNCSLVISEVGADDDAKYTCKAMNSLGEATCTAELIVELMVGEEEEE